MLQAAGYSTKKVAHNCVQLKCVYRVEREENQCKCVKYLHNGRLFLLRTIDYFCFVPSHCRMNVFLFPFLFFFLTFPCITVFKFPKSGDFASRDMIISFRVWLSGRDDFRRELYNSTVVWIKIFYYLFPVV